MQLRGEYLFAACGEGGMPGVRRGVHRQQGVRRADHVGPGLTRGSAVPRPDGSSRLVAPEHRGRGPDPEDEPGEQGTADRSVLRLRLRDRQVRRADPGRHRRHGGRPPGQQLPEARPDVQPRRHPGRGGERDDGRPLRLHLLRRRAGGCLGGRSKKPQIGRHRRAVKHAKAVQVQFRYAYLCDERVKDPRRNGPGKAGRERIRIPDVHNIYLARTYAYLAAGPRNW